MRVSNLKKEKSHPNLVNVVFIVWRSNENDLVVMVQVATPLKIYVEFMGQNIYCVRAILTCS